MTDRTNIALPSVEAVATMTEPELRALLVQLAAHEQQLAAVHAAIAARVAAPATTNGHPEHDVIDDVHEVARVVRRSVSWVRKRGHTLPGFQQPGGKGCKVSWSRHALEAWASPTS